MFHYSVAANYSFGDEGTAELASHLKHNKHLIDLQWVHYTTLSCPLVMCIRFSRCGLTSRGAASLGEMLQHNKHLTSLGYGENIFTTTHS